MVILMLPLPNSLRKPWYQQEISLDSEFNTMDLSSGSVIHLLLALRHSFSQFSLIIAKEDKIPIS